MKEKVILAYSGGLDTTAIIPWLKENFDYEVICCLCRLRTGQKSWTVWKKEQSPAVLPSSTLKMSLTSSVTTTSCPAFRQTLSMRTSICSVLPWHVRLIAKKLVEIARKEGATAICHGATGKGNDQIRFELGIKALAPDLKIIAAWRNDECGQWIPVKPRLNTARHTASTFPSPPIPAYSRDRNIWHISHEGLELEDPANEPNYDHLLVLGTTPEKAPDEAEYVTMTFEKGVPTSVNGKKMKVSEIITTLNELGGKHGIGIVDIVENRVVGMKSRGVYETPGGTILMEAHQQLEELILDRDTYAMKKEMGSQFCTALFTKESGSLLFVRQSRHLSRKPRNTLPVK